MKARRAAAVTVLVLVLLAAALVQPAAASSIKWLVVQLGTHRFGHLRAPSAVVAHAGPQDVGFECGKPSACQPPEPSAEGGCGCIDVLPQGPSSFDVGRDGSIWLLDIVNNRLVVWRRGQAARPARTIALPRTESVGDFALGRDGTIYLIATPSGAGQRKLWALARTGRVRWQAPLTRALSNARDAQLRIGPDGSVYVVRRDEGRGLTWTALTTPEGRPLPLSRQRTGSPFQPLASGLRLLETQPSAREIHFALADRAGKIVRAWRVTSRTALGEVRAAPALVGSDLVVAVDVTQQSQGKLLWEHLILRLGPGGAVKQRFTLDARAAWDPDGTTVSTALRVGPDGRLYQLRTDPKTGASIARYSLGSS
jgi:hypothetical protein